ncbi:hypothetical protein [Desulfovibrio ferrophilus]|uniref:Uncharacterized protein n=1 Tax=Desulfovibrio ferrophilus TaxID=241368 RepID=A0A2Z6AUR9_9BACT|nr:hypothetical protein [Desulfovibrio ferrophilus]BBD06968.1 uncharacterized protein DFE_0242 [Desulfovibrio ferrophilus]
MHHPTRSHNSTAALMLLALFAAFLGMNHSVPPAYATTSAAAQEASVEYVAGVGFIDWEDAKAVASGTGAPPANAANLAQARAAARRAAVLDARRNLMEVVGQVRIDSQTTVRNLLVQNDLVTSRVQGILAHSTIVAEQMLADGSVRVTVSVPLTGELAREILDRGSPTAPAGVNRTSPLEERVRILEARVAALTNALETFSNDSGTSPATGNDPLDMQTRRKFSELDTRLRQLENRGSQQPPAAAQQRSSAPSLPPAVRAEARATTGLIIDARGTDFKPTLRPNIVSGDRLLYPADSVDFKKGIGQGFVRYYRELAQAQQSQRAGAAPKIIRAQAVDGKLQIPPADADFLQNVLAESGNFLDRCQVVVVF